MEWAIVAIVVIALGVAALAAAGGMGGMPAEPIRDVYRQSLPAEPLTAHDLTSVRFAMTLRGYAMSQVDDLLARLAREIGDRDALIAGLLAGPAEPELTTEPEPASEGEPVATGQPGHPLEDPDRT